MTPVSDWYIRLSSFNDQLLDCTCTFNNLKQIKASDEIVFMDCLTLKYFMKFSY